MLYSSGIVVLFLDVGYVRKDVVVQCSHLKNVLVMDCRRMGLRLIVVFMPESSDAAPASVKRIGSWMRILYAATSPDLSRESWANGSRRLYSCRIPSEASESSCVEGSLKQSGKGRSLKNSAKLDPAQA
jgi:hypothetical protein